MLDFWQWLKGSRTVQGIVVAVIGSILQVLVDDGYLSAGALDLFAQVLTYLGLGWAGYGARRALPGALPLFLVALVGCSTSLGPTGDLHLAARVAERAQRLANYMLEVECSTERILESEERAETCIELADANAAAQAAIVAGLKGARAGIAAGDESAMLRALRGFDVGLCELQGAFPSADFEGAPSTMECQEIMR
jgi:hypothetical protein